MLGSPFVARALLIWLFCLSFLPVAIWSAEPKAARPVAVFAVANLDRFLSETRFVASEVGGANASTAILLASGWLQGIDRTRPLGVLFYLEDRGPRGVGFLPLTDFDSLRKRIEDRIGRAEETGEGIYRLRSVGNTQIYFRTSGKWVYIADARRHLLAIPQDPSVHTRTVVQEDTLAFRFDFSALSPESRQAIDEVVEGWLNAIAELTEVNRGDDSSVARLRAELQQQQVRTIRQFLKDAETVTLGAKALPQNGRITAHLTLRFAEESEWVRQWKDAREQSSDGGVLTLRHPDAALTFFARHQLTKTDCRTWEATTALVKRQLTEVVQSSDDAHAKELIPFIDRMIDQLQKTVDERMLAISGTLWLQDETARFGVAMRVADGRAIEQELRELARKMTARPGAPKVDFDVANAAGVVMHELHVDLPAAEKEARLVFGPQLAVTFGFGEKTVYVVLGKDGTPWLKEQLLREDSPQLPDGVVSETIIALAPLLKNLPEADAEKRQQIRRLVRLVESSGGRDRIRVTIAKDARTIDYRLEVDAGVLKLLSAWSRYAKEND